MFQYPIENFRSLYRYLCHYLLTTKPIHTGEWQSMDTSSSPIHATHELEDVSIRLHGLPTDADDARKLIQPDLPWADDHFAERVSGIPHNPPPSAASWPYAVRGHVDHTHGGQFDHTYPERFWSKFANVESTRPNGRQVFVPHNGIRFEYGDLMDLVALLARSPLTRQAYLPVWFPEDTGAVSGQRVPCTLGYHFMIRNGRLTCRYYLRSCDVYRHMVNDVYFAVRLTQWICGKLNGLFEAEPVVPGDLVMHISSLHAFVADRAKLGVIARGDDATR